MLLISLSFSTGSWYDTFNLINNYHPPLFKIAIMLAILPGRKFYLLKHFFILLPFLNMNNPLPVINLCSSNRLLCGSKLTFNRITFIPFLITLAPGKSFDRLHPAIAKVFPLYLNTLFIYIIPSPAI